MAALLAVLPWILASSLFATADAPVAVHVRGVVFDPGSNPVAGASVTILTSADESPEARVPAVLASGTTAADGSFDVPLAEAPLALRVRIAKAPFEVSLVDDIEPTAMIVELGSVGLAPAVALEGIVIDNDGKPVEGAEVVARSAVDVGPWEPTPDRAVRTGADGTFRFERLPRAPLELGTSKSGLRTRYRRGLDLRTPNASPVRVILEPALPPRTLVVIGSDGKPLAGATFVKTSSAGAVPFFDGHARAALRSDAKGQVLIELPLEPGVHLDVSAPAHVTRTLTELPQDGRVQLASGRLATIRLVAENGASIPIREVRIESYERAGSGWDRAETRIRSPLAQPTDAGAWTTTLPLAETVRVSVQSSDGEQFPPVELTAATLVTRTSLQDPLPVEIARGAPLVIEGVVTDPGGAPLVGERIELQHASPVSGQRRPFRAVSSGEGGHFRFDAVPAGAYAVQGLTFGAASSPMEASADRAAPSKPVELRMETQRRALVTLREGTEPPALPRIVDVRRYEGNTREGAFVVLETTRCGTDGAAVFTTLPAGELLVVAHAAPDVALWTYRNQSAELPHPDFTYGWNDRLKSGESPTTTLDLPAVAPSWIVTDVTENGAPAAKAKVSAIVGPETLATATTGPEGRVALRVRAKGPVALRVERGPLRAESSVEVEPGVDAKVALALGVGSVAGRIVNRDGKGVDRIRIALERDDGTGTFGSPVDLVTGVDGGFTLPTIAVGTYRVVAIDPQHAFGVVATQPFAVAAGDHVNLPDLVAPKAATVRVKLTTTAGTRVPFATVTVTGVGAPLPHKIEAWCAEGKTDVRGLPPGTVRIELKVHGAFTTPEPVVIELLEGGSADVAFETSKS